MRRDWSSMLSSQIDTRNMSRLDWLRLRQSGIGGSDAAAVLGLNKWRSPLDVWSDKVTAVQDSEAGEAAYWGMVLEDVVAKEFAARTGLSVRRRNFMLRSIANPYMLANIDREIVGEAVGLECKTASAYRREEWSGEEIPVEYIVQCQHYMAVTGYAAWWIAVLIGGNTFVYKRIERDEEIIAMLLEQEGRFWRDYVVPKVMPPADGSEACTKALGELYPYSNGASVDLDSESETLLTKRQRLKERLEALDKEINAIDNTIKAKLGEAESGRAKGFLVKWPSVTANRVDSKLLKSDYPDVYQACLKESVSRRFSVKEIKEA